MPPRISRVRALISWSAALLCAVGTACSVRTVGDADSATAAAAADSARATTPAPAATPTPATSAGALPADSTDSVGTHADSLDAHSADAGASGAGTRAVSDSVRIEVDLAARRLRLFQHDRVVATYPVAVGTSAWPTQPGEWTVRQVVVNPEWIPPKEEAWAESKERKAPGAPDNPLGQAQLVYDPPRTVHGTNEPSSIGKAASHGSIRMRNADIVKLATRVLALTGADKDAAWMRSALAKRTEKQVVDLPAGVPIRVH